MCSYIYLHLHIYIYIYIKKVSSPYINILIWIYFISTHFIHMHHLVTMHHNQIYFIHISILTKYSDQVQPRSHFYNLSKLIAHNVHTPPILITESLDWVWERVEGKVQALGTSSDDKSWLRRKKWLKLWG
jgi:hypothetical protein